MDVAGTSTKLVRYSVYESAAFGALRIAGEAQAITDREALKQAREILPQGAGELREGGRVVCRFGRAETSQLRT